MVREHAAATIHTDAIPGVAADRGVGNFGLRVPLNEDPMASMMFYRASPSSMRERGQ